MSDARPPHAQIDWGEDGQPVSRAFEDVYFSRASGLEETRYVFLEQNHLRQRWQSLQSGDCFTIGETGFGTGLNFLAAWQLWREAAPADAQLHFISVEKYPLHLQDLQRALALWPELAELGAKLEQQYPPLLAPGVHRLRFGNVTLSLVIGEASEGFASLRLDDPARDRQVDAWFLDGFAPSKNPAMWQTSLFEQLGALSGDRATFATFTCAGIVKRGLRDVGFALEKVPGFGHKREMLRGCLSPESLENPPQYPSTPWHLPETTNTVSRVAVIGAGISGATTARALAERGLAVTVFERGSAAGSEASGNRQGILYAKLSPAPGANGDFNLHALMFALRYYQANCPELLHLDGMLQLSEDDKEAQLHRKIGHWLDQQAGTALARLVDAREASEIAGLSLARGGLYFPGGGWLEPANVCAALLQHPNITTEWNTDIVALEHNDQQWQLRDAGDRQFSSEAIVVCAANGVRQLGPTAALPLNPIRGQVTTTAATPISSRLQCVLCSDGYITPAIDNLQSFGATFKLRDTATEVRASEAEENLDTLRRLLPDVADAFAGQPLAGRAAVRAATPDYLPMAGPIPCWPALEETYSFLRRNRKALIPTRTDYQPDLYALAGLGSRGFTYAPLAAEVVASWICGEPMPLPRPLVQALHPARFAIRALGRHRSETK